jgi:hypothetical protein
MSTTNGLSRFDPGTGEFRNFSSPDGLPGTDLTGYSACYQTSDGDMYFGGFAGAVGSHRRVWERIPTSPR